MQQNEPLLHHRAAKSQQKLSIIFSIKPFGKSKISSPLNLLRTLSTEGPRKPVDLAAFLDAIECVDWLIEQGANVGVMAAREGLEICIGPSLRRDPQTPNASR
jgi:hypothetical protein